MFQFFKRVKTVVSSELNHMIDQAEDPVKMLDQYLREMEKDIRDVEQATAKIMAEEKLQNKKLEETAALVKKREEQAIQALKANDENLARRTLEDKQRVAEELEQRTALHRETAQGSLELQEKLKEMKAEYREMETRKESLKARASTAKARTKMNSTLSSIGSEGAKKGFERMEQKVLQYEAEAETSEDLRASHISLDDELKQLDQKNSIDLELQQLKENR